MFRRTFLAGGILAAQGMRGAVRVAPERPFPGSPILFSLDGGPASGTWMERPISFELDPAKKRWVALAAVGLNVKPGPQLLTLGTGEMHTVQVAPHAYRRSRITVPPRFVSPPKSVLERIAEEREIKKAAFAKRSRRMWAGAFAAPAETVRTSPFGTKRTYNGKTQSIHQGLDFRAKVGTAIRASNHGSVVIAQEMYYEGGLVVLDHGEGLFTLYMHLSKFLVQTGEAVEKGAVIAESGSSGRVTGPHLHFGVQWQGLYMEPGTLLDLAV